jgi:hypothetical protein
MSKRGTPPFGKRPDGPAPRETLRATPRAPGPRRGRILAGSLTGAAHLALLAVLFWPTGAPAPEPAKPTLPDLQVNLLPTPPGPADATEAEAGAPTIALPTPPQAVAPIITIAAAPSTSDLLSPSQLAGAARAGEGGGGGGCDMARAVQQALRRDPLVRTAVAGADRLGRASMLWNGDWVRSGGQDGKGLAAVRQAVVWEVGFSPEACRNTRVHGLVLLTLADGNTRFAIGAGDWRWSDLLGTRAVR